MGTGNTNFGGIRSGAYVGVPTLAQSATVYVTADGNDSHDGLTWNTAKATIQAACEALPAYTSGQTPSGGVVEVGAGTFTVDSYSRTDAGCVITSGSKVIANTAAIASDVGGIIQDSATMATNAAVIESVDPGVSWTVAQAATSSTTKSLTVIAPAITIPVGVKLRGRGKSMATGAAAGNYVDMGNTTLIQDNGTGITVAAQPGYGEGNTAVQVSIEDISVWGNATNYYGFYAAQIWFVQAERCDFSNHGRWGAYMDANTIACSFRDCYFGYNGTWAAPSFITGGFYCGEEGATTAAMVLDNCMGNHNTGFDYYGSMTMRECQAAVTGVSTYTDPATGYAGGAALVVWSSLGGQSYVRGVEFESGGANAEVVIITGPGNNGGATIFEACSFAGANQSQVHLVGTNSGAIFDGCHFDNHQSTGQAINCDSFATPISWRNCQSSSSSPFIGLPAGVQIPATAAGGVGSTTAYFSAAPQTSLAGTTAGSANSSQPEQGLSYKKFLVYLSGYENTTATAQTITFPTAFSHTPYLAHDDSGGSTVSTTTLTLPASMAAAKTGWVVVEGY